MTHTPGPKLCPKCGERQPDTQDWFGEAIRQKAINADLLAALENLMEYWNNGTSVHPGALVVDMAAKAVSKAKGITI